MLKHKNELDIIVCDDSKLARQILINELSNSGINNIRSAASGDNLLEEYKTQKADLVFLDLIMPDKSGQETLKELIEYDNEAQVIIVSSVGTSENLKDILKIGARDFIQKPIEKENLELIIERILS